MSRAGIVAAVLLIVVVLVGVYVFLVPKSETTNVDLYGNGAAAGEGISNATVPGGSTPPGSTPAPAPAPSAPKVGTYAMAVDVLYTDGTDQPIVGSRGFDIFYNNKAVASLVYVGEFRPDQDVTFRTADNSLKVARTDTSGNVQTALTYGATAYGTAKAGTHFTLLSVQIYIDQIVPTTAAAGTYHVVFTMNLKWAYPGNGTAGPSFYIVFPDITVTTSASSGGGGGGGGAPRFVAVLPALFVRVR